jgi:hypothetical protein
VSRRVPSPQVGSIGVRAARMAKGGRVSSESRVRKFRPYIGDAGEEAPPPPEGRDVPEPLTSPETPENTE